METENKTLNMKQTRANDVLTCKLAGWLDPNTTSKLKQEIDLNGVKNLLVNNALMAFFTRVSASQIDSVFFCS